MLRLLRNESEDMRRESLANLACDDEYNVYLPLVDLSYFLSCIAVFFQFCGLTTGHLSRPGQSFPCN